MTTPIMQASFPPYERPEEEPPKEGQAELDVVDYIVRYGGGVSPFASTGPEKMTKPQILSLLREAKERLDADYLDAVNTAHGRYR
jgi:hypothetical protein